MNKVILTFDDVVASQLEIAVPILLEMGFTGTFFVCDWFRDSQVFPHAQGMATQDLITLHKQGFELGNHSRTHANPATLTVQQNLDEIQAIEDLCLRLNLPGPHVYAYPGGPFAENAETALRQKHYSAARTTEPRPLDEHLTNPLRLPSFPITEHHPEVFAQALQALDHTQDIMLTYHGVPDREHPWCTVTPETFRGQMQALKDAQATSLTLSQYIQQLS